MKLPKELTRITKTSKTLAIILFLTLPFVGFLLGMRYQQMEDSIDLLLQQESIPISRAPTPPPLQVNTTQWKTYTNTLTGVSISYPPTWTVKLDHVQGNRVVENPKEINEAVLTGPEGEVTMQWGPIGFGGGCDQKDNTTIMIKGKSYPVCRVILDNGTQFWGGLSANDKNYEKITGITAQAHPPLAKNSPIIETVLRTLVLPK